MRKLLLGAGIVMSYLGLPAVPAIAASVPPEQQEVCVARNIYHESRGEGAVGMVAVANVTLNRAHNESSDPCHVVFSRNSITCQFAWTCHAIKSVERDHESWEKAITVARAALTGGLKDVTHGATFFHRCNRPLKGNPGFTRLIGHHCFFQNPDDAGKTAYDPDAKKDLSGYMNLSYVFMKSDSGYDLVPMSPGTPSGQVM